MFEWWVFLVYCSFICSNIGYGLGDGTGLLFGFLIGFMIGTFPPLGPTYTFDPLTL